MELEKSDKPTGEIYFSKKLLGFVELHFQNLKLLFLCEMPKFGKVIFNITEKITN